MLPFYYLLLRSLFIAFGVERALRARARACTVAGAGGSTGARARGIRNNLFVKRWKFRIVIEVIRIVWARARAWVHA